MIGGQAAAQRPVQAASQPAIHPPVQAAIQPPIQAQAPVMTAPVGSPVFAPPPLSSTGYPAGLMSPGGASMGSYAPPTRPPTRHPPAPARRASSRVLWWVLALVVIAAGAGTAAGILLSK
jgi:hypothetical protein